LLLYYVSTSVVSLSISVSAAILPDGMGWLVPENSVLDFIRLKDDGGGGDIWTYKTCKAAPVKSSPPTNQRPAFCRPDTLPVTQPTVSEH